MGKQTQINDLELLQPTNQRDGSFGLLLANQRDGSFGLPLAYVWCAYGMQTKSYYVCSGNVVWGWRRR